MVYKAHTPESGKGLRQLVGSGRVTGNAEVKPAWRRAVGLSRRGCNSSCKAAGANYLNVHHSVVKSMEELLGALLAGIAELIAEFLLEAAFAELAGILALQSEGPASEPGSGRSDIRRGRSMLRLPERMVISASSCPSHAGTRNQPVDKSHSYGAVDGADRAHRAKVGPTVCPNRKLQLWLHIRARDGIGALLAGALEAPASQRAEAAWEFLRIHSS